MTFRQFTAFAAVAKAHEHYEGGSGIAMFRHSKKMLDEELTDRV
jgi:hypothetical protein